MGLLGNMINIIGKGVAKGVSDIVEKKVAEAIQPAATKFAQKQAELIDNAAKNIESANEALKHAGEEAEKTATQNSDELKMAMELLRQNARKAAEELGKLEIEHQETDEEVMARWETLLPDFPKWTCGGNHFSFEEEDIDGQHYVRFYLSAAEASWLAYQAKMISNGFRMKYRSDTSFWYKEEEGKYPAIHLFHIDYDACEMQLIYYHETKEEIEEAARL